MQDDSRANHPANKATQSKHNMNPYTDDMRERDYRATMKRLEAERAEVCAIVDAGGRLTEGQTARLLWVESSMDFHERRWVRDRPKNPTTVALRALLARAKAQAP